MAVYHGKRARLYLSPTGTGVAIPVASLNMWSMDQDTDVEETTSFGDANKTYVQGLPDVSIEFSGFYNDTDGTVKAAAVSADGSKAYVYVSTDAPSKYAYGPCWVSYSIESPADGPVTVSGSLTANGAWGNNT